MKDRNTEEEEKDRKGWREKKEERKEPELARPKERQYLTKWGSAEASPTVRCPEAAERTRIAGNNEQRKQNQANGIELMQ